MHEALIAPDAKAIRVFLPRFLAATTFLGWQFALGLLPSLWQVEAQEMVLCALGEFVAELEGRGGGRAGVDISCFGAEVNSFSSPS